MDLTFQKTYFWTQVIKFLSITPTNAFQLLNLLYLYLNAT